MPPAACVAAAGREALTASDRGKPAAGGSVGPMSYLVGASRTQLIRLKHMEPGTRVLATERVPSGPFHAVSAVEDAEALCGAEVVEVLDQSFTADSDLIRCAECEGLVKQG